MTEDTDRPRNDVRLYLPSPEGWSARIKQDWEKEYCFQKNPGEDFFHLLMQGEIYIEGNEQRFCLSCALRRGILTHDRLNWQHAARKRSSKLPL